MVEMSALLLLFLVAGSIAEDQLFKTPQIYSLHIRSDITYRYSTTKVTSRIKNPGNSSREAVFDVTLPDEAFITNLTIEMDDGKIIVGEIKEKEEAKKQYEEARDRGESAGYIGNKQRNTNKFVLSIAVAPLSKINFNLTYQELLKRKLGFYEHVIFIDPGQTVQDMEVTVSILESRNITRFAVPSLRNDVGDAVADVSDIVVITRPTEKSAIVRYAPTEVQQMRQSKDGIAGKFLVQYAVERAKDLGDLMLVNGYFVHFFAPEGLKPIPNDVLFILDTSGSMSGKKISQLIDAMEVNLLNLNDHDRFNIMSFSHKTKLWRQSMADVNDEDHMESAKAFVKKIEAGGWTDINSALTKGLSFLVNQTLEDSKNQTRTPLIVFLTDGEPTKGEDNPQKILKNVRKINEGNIPIFTLAFGETADWNFVRKLALQNNGFGRKIHEASDAAMQIMGFYQEISATLLSDVTFTYLDSDVTNLTRTHFANYFKGSEVIVSGFLPRDPEEVNVSVKYNEAESATAVVLSGEFGEQLLADMGNVTAEVKDFEEITEKVWAYLTIKQLLDKMESTDEQEEQETIKTEIIRLSLKYGFVTPLTSMVVSKATNLLESPSEDKAKPSSPQPQPVNIVPMSGGVLSQAFFEMSYDHYDMDPVLHANARPSRRQNHLYRPRPKYQVTRAHPKKMNKSKKHKTKAKKRKPKKIKSKVFPLIVRHPDLNRYICFALIDPYSRRRPSRYMLYENGDCYIVVTMSQTQSRKTRRASIKTVHIYEPSKHLTFDIYKPDEWPKPNTSLETMTLTFNKTERAITITTKGSTFTLIADNNEFHVIAEGDQLTDTLNGMLGKILLDDFELLKIYQSKARRSAALVQINGNRQRGVVEFFQAPGKDQPVQCLAEKKSRKSNGWFNVRETII